MPRVNSACIHIAIHACAQNKLLARPMDELIAWPYTQQLQYRFKPSAIYNSIYMPYVL